MSTATQLSPSSKPAFRYHSARVQEAAKSWHTAYKSWSTSPSNEADIIQLVWSIAAEAAYLGFPRTARLCRALHAAIRKASATPTALIPLQDIATISACEALCVLVSNPYDETPDVASLAQTMRTAFHLTEQELNQPISGLSIESKEHTNSHATSLEHRDMDVYLSARLDTLDRCTEEETWIVAQLASLAEDLASGLQSQRPAQRLMKVLASHKFFHQIDRVCLAGRVPNANQLMIVDACTSERCHKNTLKTGYSCFVNPEGSLFKMRPGTMRIFDDSDRVLSTFAAGGRPAQRSIAIIDDMGLRSGLCLAIGRDSDVQGFMFLNSCQPQVFRDINVGFAPLISLLGLVATIALDSNGFHKSCGRMGELDRDLPRTSSLFERHHFLSYLQTALNSRFGSTMSCQLNLTIEQQLDDFLYLPAQVAGSLGELVLRLQLVKADVLKLDVNLTQQADNILFSLCHGVSRAEARKWEWMRSQVDFVSQLINNTPLKLSVSEEFVSLQMPFEPVLQSHRDIRYSVVF